MLDPWLQIGGGALLLLVLGTLLKCVSDIGQIKGTLSALATRVDAMDTAMNARFLRIENLLIGRPPGQGEPPAGD